MKNKGIVIFLVILALVIVAVFVGEYMSDKPNKSKANPYEYNIDEFKDVDDDLVLYKETKNFKIGFDEPDAVAAGEGKILVSGDGSLKIIDFSGVLQNEFSLPGKSHSLKIEGGSVYVTLEKQVLVFSENGDELLKMDLPGENTYLTSVAVFGNDIFVADAGNRRIIRFSKAGEKIAEFEGKAGDDILHGFIIPSPYFDIDINGEGELWVVNPGMHALENYTFDGDLRAFWENTSMKIDGFSGCCNPAHFTFLPDGNFVTSEKGLVRIKVHKPSGELLGVVAPPVKFDTEDQAPDIAADSLGNIYALDFERKIIRVFELK
ncbi:NHL repeat-containing protein [Maribellus maritimus]|uniref:hypothetical protein n=1 Tax=Maribellus maritimus TaxID=2870838 RepID=UPI001EEA2BAD|nr:hypothetical protein [Maribellus maritimus]MCG6185786.1 hypothetical protein [Maribellus maritimus]